MALTTSGCRRLRSDGATVLDSMEIFSCPVSPCGSPSPTPDGNGNGDAYCYPGAEVYADAKAASHTAASALSLRLTVVSSGTRDHSRVPEMCTSLEEITRSAESSSRMSERGARVANLHVNQQTLRAAALASGEPSGSERLSPQ